MRLKMRKIYSNIFSAMAVMHIDKGAFQKEVLDHKGLVFVDFYADWCGPCKMTEPIIEELAKELTGVKFVKVNVDENQELASSYQVFSIPTFMIFKDGQAAHQFVGAMGKEGFLQEIKTVKPE
ncbi:MAG: Thioredoxin [Candidatus Roizmanbacteria bacterium GW2011_GWC2_37_13]|uniref:Thioredoxin n=1 Tax=Candidatus Roizmanbacteria bacterium GW2011_GWC2_37_13 TaxID=1618486 RepID=A0A0G0GJ76_9BACT|nr:MAG: Thioredoxin [Candidatus Roizmanbacteria bacterium GW2011_GWC2_37_13]